MYTDETVLNWGRHKLFKLIDVPKEYLINFYNNKSYYNDQLKEYVETNIESIRERIPPKIPPKKILQICHEAPFPTKQDAKYELKKIQRSGYKGFDVPIRTYECKVCGAWHITSEPVEKFKNTESELICEKIPFDTQKSAKKELKRIKTSRTHNKHIPVREYQCEDCGKWHLTSQPRTPSKAQ